MSWLYRHCLRPALFSLDSEVIHDRTLAFLEQVSASSVCCRALAGWLDVPKLPVHVFGLHFPNPLGLAAGMDKQGKAVPIWEAMGFGFSELGGVTWEEQPGNPKPRMFRVVPERALVNRMGFNNPGARAMADRLRLWKAQGLWPKHPVGINLGKSKNTPLAEAPQDYAKSYGELRDLADFFVLNISSPNTPNLRKLQDRDALDEILSRWQEVDDQRGEEKKPLLVKVAPDLTFDALDEMVDLGMRRGVAGWIATNTTVTRPETALPLARHIYQETGGLSGAPLRARSTEVIRHLYRQTGGSLPIIGVGGVFSGADAWEKVTAGATLIQVYSGLVYEGPGLVHSIVSDLLDRCAGARWDQVVGSAA
jgi:dihydroorotate dehydrogenase